VNTLSAVRSEMQATSLPSTVANAKSTICCKVAKTVGAENNVRAMPANELASSPYGSSTVLGNSLKVAALRRTGPLIAYVVALDIECRCQGLLDMQLDSLGDRLGFGELATVRTSAWRTDDGDVVSGHSGSRSKQEVDSSTVVLC
jgi:hypothetical protein